MGTTAAETKNPERNLPRAINSIPLRIIVFYVLALVAIMAVTPWREVVANKSPFVELFVLAGLPAAAGIINFVVLTSAMSSANSGVFSTSRMLYGLAVDGDAPGKFAALSSRAVPSNGLIFSCVCLTGGALVIYLVPNMLEAFTLITTVSALLFMFVWSIILLSYLAYRKQRDPLHQASTYKMPGGTFMCRVCLVFFAFILALLALEADTRSALYLMPVWFAVLGLAYRSIRRKRQQAMQLSFDAD
ncbi:D-serine/D-alanine/glycine transporter [compost metagenome]